MDSDLEPEQVTVLQLLAAAMDAGSVDDMIPTSVAHLSHLKPTALAYHGRELSQRRLISVERHRGKDCLVITAEGVGWLRARDAMPK